MNLLRICFLTGASMVAVTGTLIWRGGRRPSPEQREAQRRQRIHARLKAQEGATGRPEEVLDVLGADPLAARVNRDCLVIADSPPLP